MRSEAKIALGTEAGSDGRRIGCDPRKMGPEELRGCRSSRNEPRFGPYQTRRRERQMKQFKSAGQAQRFLSPHDQINNFFHLRRDHVTAAEHRAFQDPNIPGLGRNL
jgi:transposase-like protein